MERTPSAHTERRTMDAKGGGGEGGGPFTHIIHIITLFTFPLRTHTARRTMDAKGGGGTSPLRTHMERRTMDVNYLRVQNYSKTDSKTVPYMILFISQYITYTQNTVHN